ncbi:MAG TPA: TonB family protein [Steroidobacteraceae bacterium]|nr:TonB family protein [Steroidobacteraceae bacterium]
MSRSIPSPLLRRNPAGLVLVAGLHVAFLWALIVGLRIHAPREVSVDLSVGFMAPERHRPLPPTDIVRPSHLAPRLQTSQPPPIPTAEDPTVVPIEPQIATAPGDVSARAPPHEAVMTAAAIDPRAPLTQPPYPPAALRAGIEGNLALEVLVGPDGRVRDARVLRTSGSSILDQAAVDEARRHWKLRPATRDGVPFEQWYTLRVVFHLQSR